MANNGDRLLGPRLDRARDRMPIAGPREQRISLLDRWQPDWVRFDRDFGEPLWVVYTVRGRSAGIRLLMRAVHIPFHASHQQRFGKFTFEPVGS